MEDVPRKMLGFFPSRGLLPETVWRSTWLISQKKLFIHELLRFSIQKNFFSFHGVIPQLVFALNVFKLQDIHKIWHYYFIGFFVPTTYETGFFVGILIRKERTMPDWLKPSSSNIVRNYNNFLTTSLT